MKEVQCQRGTVMVPDDARGWELYSDMAGVDKAASKITEVVVDAVTNNTLYRAVVKVNAVLDQYSRFGASDTEPRYHANRVLSAAFGVEDALYVSRPRKTTIPGINALKAEVKRKQAELDERSNNWSALDAEGRHSHGELVGYVRGLLRAIEVLEEA